MMQHRSLGWLLLAALGVTLSRPASAADPSQNLAEPTTASTEPPVEPSREAEGATAPPPIPQDPRYQGASTARIPSAPVNAAVEHALLEAAVDLDITAEVLPAEALDQALEARATTSSDAGAPWLVGYRLTPQGTLWRLEVTALPPDSNVRRVVVEVLDETRAELRAMVLLRDAVRLQGVARPEPSSPAQVESAPASSGRAGLALNGAVLGGYLGVSLQQASDSEDDRLLYPLAALGVGLGLGASMLIADEWNITTEDAWYISAGLLWPATSGTLVAASYDVAPEHRYLYGLSGVAVGTTLSTIAVATGNVHSGSAAIAHSGGAFGMGLGALTQGVVEGNLEGVPLRGMGYGAGLGVLTAGILATRIEASPSRVLLVDLTALLGGLTGGALATPLLLTDEVDDARRRLWFATVGLGTLAGGALGVLLTDERDSVDTGAALAHVHPYAGVIGVSVRGTEQAPVYGGGLRGDF